MFNVNTKDSLSSFTKIIAALASLEGACLTVTGLILWYNRRFKKGKKNSK
jgi:uncharacterized iron-regulated membrane protein